MKRAFLILIMIFAAVAAAIAQTATETPPGVFNPWVALGTIGGTISAILTITGWIKTLIREEGTVAKIISWVVGLLIAAIGWFFNIGIFEPMTWWMALITGGLCTLGANGAFGYETIKSILTFLKAQPKKE